MLQFYLFHGEPPFNGKTAYITALFLVKVTSNSRLISVALDPGMPPLEAAKAAALKQLRPLISLKLPVALRNLISSCWHPDPASRPPARAVCDALEMLFPPVELSEADVVGERCTCSLQ